MDFGNTACDGPPYAREIERVASQEAFSKVGVRRRSKRVIIRHLVIGIWTDPQVSGYDCSQILPSGRHDGLIPTALKVGKDWRSRQLWSSWPTPPELRRGAEQA